jgi:hypothetical protein
MTIRMTMMMVLFMIRMILNNDDQNDDDDDDDTSYLISIALLVSVTSIKKYGSKNKVALKLLYI